MRVVAGLLVLGWLGLGYGCSSKVIGDRGDAGGSGSGGGKSTGGEENAGGLASSGGAIGSGGSVGGAGGSTGGTGPNPACPGVFSAAFADPERQDRGPTGLATLRQKVLQSQAVFRAYAERHQDTYRYTRQFDSFTGGLCETTVQVTNGVVVSSVERSNDRYEPTTTKTRAGAALSEPSCHPAVTMDALYEECLTKTLCQDPRENWLYLQIDARGLLIQCGFFPMNCADDCYEGLEPLILTADGEDWTKPLSGCCEPSPEPDCCMHYGGPGTVGNNDCGMTCDAMPLPNEPGWNITISNDGCVSWREPPEGTTNDCCGCPPPSRPDAGPHG